MPINHYHKAMAWLTILSYSKESATTRFALKKFGHAMDALIVKVAES